MPAYKALRYSYHRHSEHTAYMGKWAFDHYSRHGRNTYMGSWTFSNHSDDLWNVMGSTPNG